MELQRTLISWVGDRDLAAMVREHRNWAVTGLLPALRQLPGAEDVSSPVRQLLASERFDQVHLLNDAGAKIGKRLNEWLGNAITVHDVALKDASDYGEVYRAATAVLEKLSLNGVELCFHLSPGTSAMSAVWVLLGKGHRYRARFFQTFRNTVREIQIPFDLAADYTGTLATRFEQVVRSMAADSSVFEYIVGDSPLMQKAKAMTLRVAATPANVLILGETGTGKELFARAIHNASPRQGKPYMAFNCAAISPGLQDSTLFGSAKGSYTGALRDASGLFEQADGGTLFLDEVGECEPAVQAKLLRVLQPPPSGLITTRVFSRVGELRERKADVRIIAATNRDLSREIAIAAFRGDLYYRLGTFTLTLPPLRQRRQDILPIAQSILRRINASLPSQPHNNLSDDAIAFVQTHDWPGNIRHLQNVLWQAAILSSDNEICRSDLVEALAEIPAGAGHPGLAELPLGNGFNLQHHLEEIHRQYLQRAMTESRNVQAQAAKLLGIESYQTLAAQLRRLGVSVPDCKT